MGKLLKFSIILILSTITMLAIDFQLGYAQLQDIVDTRETDQIVLFRGDVVTLKVFSLTRVAITEPGVFEIGKLEADEMMLIGQRAGETTLFIWDEYGKRKIGVRVITQDFDQIIKRLEALFASAGIQGLTLDKNLMENKIIIKGKVLENKQDRYKEIMQSFMADIMDMTDEDSHLIRMDVQITELTTTLTKTLGIQWTTGTAGLVFPYKETLPAFNGDLGDLFKIGDFERTTAIQSAVNMLLAEGKARVLSKPSVIVTAGQAATFTVGGEIPVRTTSTAEGAVSENINYKTYGVTISATPEIKGDKIDITLSITVSDIDASNAVGSDVAFVTRSATTKLLLEQGQTIILAGLIKSNKGENLTRVPVLSKIPIVGLLFRSKNWSPNKEEEIVIAFTPTILDGQPEKETVSKEAQVTQEGAKETHAEEIIPGTTKTGPGGQELQSLPTSQSEDEMKAKIDSIIAEASPAAAVLEPPSASWEATLPPEELKTPSTAKPEELAGAMSTGDKPGELEEEYVFSEENISDALTRYVQKIQQKISQAISFPYKAKENNWHGTAKLALVILSDGTLIDIFIEESSGYDIFDEDALNTAQLLAPFDPFPAEISLEEIKITLPIVYSQEAVLLEVQ